MKKIVRGVTKIEQITENVYGVNALTCDAVVIEWAALKVAETDGVEVAGREWQRINARRYRLGRYTMIPRWGHELHAAYFGKAVS